ncbi:hypothetical protein CR152_11425 [Massilia violaceinigra]|uniref:Uncharacterized protein n=1 Tax=Massilia violaceinigra TaxID=2045208 RepID=A0A2D2DJC1_9BURK|nr:hypothetical protein [Massilia violaceinigra]ATQ75062.1 hypothetical protein CR152_11425 [Massilia violaceinigra]
MINEADVKANSGKTQHLLADTSLVACAPLQTLMNLDRYLGASGYDASHPWRLEIAAAVAADQSPNVEQQFREIALARANDAADLATVAVSFINDHISPAVGALVEVIEGQEKTEYSSRYSHLVLRLAKLARHLVIDAATCLESERDAMHAKLAALENEVAA